MKQTDKVVDIIVGFFAFLFVNAVVYRISAAPAPLSAEAEPTQELVTKIIKYGVFPLLANVCLFYLLASWRPAAFHGALYAAGFLLILPIVAGICVVVGCAMLALMEGWPTALLGGIYPTGTLTLVLPLQVGSQMTASLQVSLTVPKDASGPEVTVITATSHLSPTVQDAATDVTIVSYRVYLPMTMRTMSPPPDVRLTHIEWNPPGPDLDGEFVIVENRGQGSQGMTGWTLSDADYHTYFSPPASFYLVGPVFACGLGAA